MKHIVSVSIGSSKRDKRTEQELLGEKVIVERIGTDGSIERQFKSYAGWTAKWTRLGWAE